MNEEAWFDKDVIVQGSARALGLRGTRGLRPAIIESSLERIDGWASAFDVDFETVNDVLDLVKNQARVETVCVHSDAQLADIARTYAKDAGTRQLQLELEFNKLNTEALVFQRDEQLREGPRFVAVVDARGERRNRAWFSARHEPTHLVIRDPSTGLVWRRRGEEKPTPIERLVDDVASEIAFWRPLVEPQVRAAVAARRSKFDAFEFLRNTIAPEASRAASYRAFVRYVDTPLLIVYCREACRKEHRRLGELSDSWCLRIGDIITNAAARREGLFIPGNYRVPAHSCIHRAISSGLPQVQDDTLSAWTSSSGSRLRAIPVRVEAHGPWVIVEMR